MILFPLGFICGPICWVGVACLVAGNYCAGIALVASSWTLAFGVIYLAWRANTREAAIPES